MFRTPTTAIFLCLFIGSASAQTPAPQGAAAGVATKASPPAVKPTAKKSTPRTKTAAKPAAESGPCQIGVIPYIGDVFVVQRVGLSVFGNEYAEVPTNGWGLDDLVVARIRAAAPGIAVRKITGAKDAFASIERGGLSALFRDTNADLIAIVRQIVAGTPCKRYMLVDRSSIPFSNTTQNVRGVGLVGWAGRSYLFALSYIRIIDGESFSILKRGAASTNDEPLISRVLLLNPVRGPSRQLEGFSFPGDPNDAANDAALRDGARALLAASLDQTVPAMLAETP